MSFRTLRRFFPRGIPRAQAESSPRAVSQAALRAAAPTPARSLNTIRDLAVGDGSYGPLAVAALAGLFGILYLKKNTDASVVAVAEMPNEKPVNEPVSKVSNRAAIKQVEIKEEAGVNARLKNNGTGFSLENYLEEMTKVAAAQKRAREVSDKTVNEVTDMEVMTEDDEAAMKARFEDWMKEYSRTYKSEEEKARRYKIFKSFAKVADKATANARGGARFVTNHTADWTDEEFRCVYGVGIDWDEYLDEIKYFIAKKKSRDARDVTNSKAIEEEQGNKELEACDVEGNHQADNS